MIKVVQLQFSKESAGKSALRLHNAFCQKGIDSSIISLNSDDIIDTKITYLRKKSRIISKLDSKIKAYINRNTIKEYGEFSFPILGTNVSGMQEIKNADVLYLHWTLGGFLNLSNIQKLLKLGKPMIVIMHDMWHITGGCHYSFTCEKFVSGCYNCQMLPRQRKNDLSAKGFYKKLKLYSKFDNLYFVSPSKWLYDCAKKALLTKNKPIYYIPNVIDNKLFKPFDKSIAKKILNIDINETVIAFGAVKVNSPYKGWTYLQQALEILSQDKDFSNTTILIFGSGYDKQIANAIPFKTKFMGYLKDDYSVILTYNASDVFIVPSIADNQPTTVMESMCCGTPVVGFDIGGIPDMINHKVNGYLAKYKNSEDIADGIRFCIKNKIRGKILPSFEKNEIVKKHLDIINSLLQ
ncbi:MAG TPA: glycosyltransferase [Hanamia sp.]